MHFNNAKNSWRAGDYAISHMCMLMKWSSHYRLYKTCVLYNLCSHIQYNACFFTRFLRQSLWVVGFFKIADFPLIISTNQILKLVTVSCSSQKYSIQYDAWILYWISTKITEITVS